VISHCLPRTGCRPHGVYSPSPSLQVFWSAVFAIPSTLNWLATFADRLVTDAMITLFDV
jgi:hypothetical protein